MKNGPLLIGLIDNLLKVISLLSMLTDLGGQTRMQGTSLIRTVAGGDGLGKGNVIVRGKPTATNFSKGLQRQIPSNSRPQYVTRTRDGERYHPLPNNPHVVTIKNDKADFYNPSYQQVARYFDSVFASTVVYGLISPQQIW